MADTPTPRSYQQALGDLIDAFLSRQGLKKLRVGSPLLSIMEAAAQSDMRSSQDTFGLLNAVSLDKATGLALERIGNDENVPKYQQSATTGTVDISDASFTKRATKLFQGSPAPIAGSMTIDVVDAGLWPSSGQLYIGRGTPNYEGPISYTSKVNAGTHYTITLAAGTARFHNTSESVILAQGGNRQIGQGVIVKTPQANTSDAVEFTIVTQRTIPDGETLVSGVEVRALKPGNIGNVPAGAIKEWSAEPFAGATVTNPGPFSNGRETETDDDYRERIKNVRRSRALGTSLAITNAVDGITAPDENKRVSSASLVPRLNLASTLYIDDGTGYEEKQAGVAIETLADSAVGGELYFETKQRPVARAFAVTQNSAPYTLTPGAQLAVKVGGRTFMHTFNVVDFVSIANASAYEVVASINGNPTIGFRARTAESGTKVALFADVDANEDVEVVAAAFNDSNPALGFPPGINYTMQLYRNDRLLTKDGVIAAFVGENVSQWDSVSGSQTLVVAVDNTPAQTYAFVDQDFVDARTGYSTVARNTIAAWCAVIEAKIPGITATEDAGRIVLTSTAGPAAKAAVEVLGGTLVSHKFFSTGKVVGKARDYTLDRNNAQIRLEQPLLAGDKLTIGSQYTRAFIESDVIPPTSIGGVARFWFVIDGDAEVVPTGVTGGTTLAIAPTAAHPSGNVVTLTASAGTPFVNARAGDWLITWDPALDASIQGAFRIAEAAPTYLRIERRAGTAVRVGHRAAALQASGASMCKVLICGGSYRVSDIYGVNYGTPTAELYDPNTKTSTPVAPMNFARTFHSATLVPSGKVVVAGGFDGNGKPVKAIEIFDPVAGTWTLSAVQLTTGVGHHTATLMADGRIVFAGGNAGTGGAVDALQVYDPVADTITVAAHLVHPRAKHKAVLMPNNDILIAGGYDASFTDQATVEVFSHTTLLTTAGIHNMNRARSGFGLAVVGTSPTKVMAVGNRKGAAGNNTYELYDIAATTWGAETPFPAGGQTFEENDAITLTNGHVVGVHGYDGGVCVGFTYNGTTFTETFPDPTLDVNVKWAGQYVEIKNGSGTIKNIVGAFGGACELSPGWGFLPTASIEQYDEVGATWTVPDPATTTGVTLANQGLAIVRTSGIVREVDLPIGTNYTASTVAAALNTGLVGAVASVYKTNQLRISTATFAKGGDIALVAQNQLAPSFQLDTGSAVSNLTGHMAAIESGNSDLGTPSFDETRIFGTTKTGANAESVLVGTGNTYVNYGLVGLKSWWGGADGDSSFDGAAYFYPREGNNFGFRTRLKTAQSYGTAARLDVRTSSIEPWSPLDRAYLAAPFAIGPNDDLTVLVDNDTNKRFTVKMWRKLQTVGGTYAATNTFRDADGGGASLAATFGLGYSFNDFAVYMKARAVAYSDPTQQMLFRYFRFGAEGEAARVRIGNPLGPTAQVSVGVDLVSDENNENITIRLASGALRSPTLNSTTQVGQACYGHSAGDVAKFVYVLNLPISSASRTTNVDTLTLTLPPSITDHGLNVNDVVWVNSTNINFASGLKTITARTSTTISYAETAADQGATANIGTVSKDAAAEATFNGSSTVAGDFLRINDPGVLGGNATMRIAAVTNSYAQTTSGDQIDGHGVASGTTLSWTPLVSASAFQVFSNPAQTATQVAAKVNSLASGSTSKCPITVTLLGSGAGTIDRSTPDFLDDNVAWYQLADGINWVQTTTSPGSNVGDYTLLFKRPTTGSLATGADWANEEVRIAPSTTANVVAWLNTPTVTGLFTVCSIQASQDGEKVQISSKTPGSVGAVQVQGGSANAATTVVVGSPVSVGNKTVSTVARAFFDSFTGGSWCRIDNENTVPRALLFGTGVTLLSLSADGTAVFDTSVANLTYSPTQLKVQVEKTGNYVAISDMGMNGLVFWNSVEPGSVVRLSPSTAPTANMPQMSSANQGLFRVLRVGQSFVGSGGTLYIENPNAIPERSECTLTIFSPDSVMPGDKFVVATSVMGVENQGVWTVRSVGDTDGSSGDPFAHTDRFILDTTERTPLPQTNIAFSNDTTLGLVRVVEGTPASFLMKLEAVAPNQDDGAYLDIRWDRDIASSTIAGSAGSVVTALDKLDFPLDFISGIDGYSYNTGLIGEANRVVYGDPSDTATYPGVAAASARINISGPLVKRITLALALRVRSGVSNQDIADRVRSAVATVINQTGIGQPIALSTVVAAAAKVVGVISVSVLSPTYSVGNDLIAVQPFEKPLVLNLNSDIQISFAGE
jgi:hypothetical protein